MTASGSDRSHDEPFIESDDRETQMPMDKGGVPIYVAVLWVGFIIAYIVAMAVMVLPDLRAWMAG